MASNKIFPQADLKSVTFRAIHVFGMTMNLREKINSRFRAPRLTRTRIIIALAIAICADGLQLLLGPLGWTFIDQIIDVAAMVLMSWVIGFHLLLLPTFVVEFFPVVDMLPTWTACTAAVIALRKREQRAAPPAKPVIEI